jgi:hypothetical protein
MTVLYESLGFNFPNEKLGDTLYLSTGAENFLGKAPIEVPSWMESDLANATGAIDTTIYYKNPLDGGLDNCLSVASQIYTQANTVNTWLSASGSSIAPASLALIAEIGVFQSHTDNVSGVTTMTSDTDTIPSLEGAVSIGNLNLRILNTTDEISNTSPMIGSMTSLFIQDDIDANNTTFAPYPQLIQDSIYIPFYNPESEDPNPTSNLSEEIASTIVYNLVNLKNYFNERRTHDWNFYSKSVLLARNYMKVSRFLNLGNTESNLINNYIGTDQLKQNLANT